ncbi:hypothetical protein [Gemmatimonas sp.]|uniref:hypothetical protein n=1 Tax=Gemmatimonas sp. TaxID=1962908 RepID=UPI00286A0405|nr:hypothetical protein [Gemmatimonas sp.]
MSMSISMADIPGICAIMRCSTGSVITRSRITGSAIMRMWIAIRLVSVAPMPDMLVLGVAASAAPLAAPEPDMFIEEWSIAE